MVVYLQSLGGNTRRYAALILMLATTQALGKGMKLDEDGLVYVESPATVGQGKVRFDFQHIWSNGDIENNSRVPIVDLSLRGGVVPWLQLRATGLFNNGQVELGSNYAYSRFNLFEYEAQAELLDQGAGRPLSLAVAGDYARWSLRIAFNNSVAATDGKAYGGKVLAHRDFDRFGQYLAYKWVHAHVIQFRQVYEISTLALGERIKAYRDKKVQVDLIGEYAPLLTDTKKTGIKPVPVWSAGLQFKLYNPHTITFFASNGDSGTLVDSMFGLNQTFYGFRWSYRF